MLWSLIINFHNRLWLFLRVLDLAGAFVGRYYASMHGHTTD